MKILHVVGARPNFMKIAPIIEEMSKHSEKFEQVLVHTGQHYSTVLSEAFFEDLNLPRPDVFLGVGSGTHAEQTANIMIEFEKVCLHEKPDLVLVIGDVNSTLACSIVAAKLCIPVAHVEAGLRSFDRSMPEEINRIVTDSLSDILFTSCEDANENLKREGIDEAKTYFVGNVMIDTLLKHHEKSEQSGILEKLGYGKNGSTGTNELKSEHAVLTLHRPSNVDDRDTLSRILDALTAVSHNIPIVFPVHPRTKKQIELFGLDDNIIFHDLNSENKVKLERAVNCIESLGYLDFLKLLANAKFVLTDSGGIQEETTILGIPCLTLRDNTERPVTVHEGTNQLVGTDREKIIAESVNILNRRNNNAVTPRLWDGKAAQRIVQILKEIL